VSVSVPFGFFPPFSSSRQYLIRNDASFCIFTAAKKTFTTTFVCYDGLNLNVKSPSHTTTNKKDRRGRGNDPLVGLVKSAKSG
jgi:hypothetical protein